MPDKKHSIDAGVDLEQRCALLEEKNRDLVARVRVLSEESRSHGALIRALLENTPFGIVMFDSRHRLVQINKAAETILDLQRVTSIGQTCDRLFDCFTTHADNCPIPEQFNTLDRVETRCSSQACTDKHLLRSVVQIQTPDDVVLVEAFIDISEIKQAQLEIENINKIKDNFLSKISHELRTPLNSILGFAELLREGTLSSTDTDANMFLDSIYHSGRDLLRMIDEILDITRITANRMKLDEYETEIAPILQQVSQKVQAECFENDNKVALECDRVQLLVVDPYRLHQVLYHLLHNACKYTHQGKVQVKVKQNGTNVAFVISDSGKGMSEEQVKRIFQEFEQADIGYDRQYNGAGLGLSLCHHMARLMGGEIKVQSEPGKGSVFTLLLPDKSRDKLAC